MLLRSEGVVEVSSSRSRLMGWADGGDDWDEEGRDISGAIGGGGVARTGGVDVECAR